jgi:diguanylate cyclase (GGDEF)-like protein
VRAVDYEPLPARRQIWVLSAVVTLAIVVSAVFGALPLLSGQSENHQVANADLALARVTDLRTAIADWQVYLESRVPRFSPTPTPIDPIDLARGSQLNQVLTASGRDAVTTLGSLDQATADAVAAANGAFLKSIASLAPLTAGKPRAFINAVIAAERAAYAHAWTVTMTATAQLRETSTRDLGESLDFVHRGRLTALTLYAIAALVTLVSAIVFGRRASRLERIARASAERRMFETTMQHALDMAKVESDVYEVLNEALRTTVPDLQVEMLVADSNRAHFHQTLATGSDTADPRSGCAVVSPLDCPATSRAHTLIFPSSRALDACPHLKGRASGDCSAVCVAVSLTGQTVGVLHATGADGVAPADADVRYLEITSRRSSERIAMLRAFEKSEAQARSDPLTGLWNRRSLENRVHELHREGIAYALAYGDLDHFKTLNDTHGHDAGDQALRLFSRVLRESVRPNDIAARYGGEEFVIVLPDCTADVAVSVLERLRERLALTLTAGRVPAFTVSFGLASSADADTFDEVVATADRALLTAKTAGRNRVVIADPGSLRPA